MAQGGRPCQVYALREVPVLRSWTDGGSLRMNRRPYGLLRRWWVILLIGCLYASMILGAGIALLAYGGHL
jgi:hypothetical protein